MQLEADGNHAAALSLLWEAAGLAPRDPDIQNRLGEALERIGALDAAVDAVPAGGRRAAGVSPGVEQSDSGAVEGRQGRGSGRARPRARHAGRPPIRIDTSRLAWRCPSRMWTSPFAALQRALELAPRHTLARYNLALVLRRVDRPAEALAELERALAIERRPEALYTQGVIYWHQGDLGRAAAALRAAIAEAPHYADAHHALGSVLKTRAPMERCGRVTPDRDLAPAGPLLGAVYAGAGADRGGRRTWRAVGD